LPSREPLARGEAGTLNQPRLWSRATATPVGDRVALSPNSGRWQYVPVRVLCLRGQSNDRCTAHAYKISANPL
jgi:hypothetical protein